MSDMERPPLTVAQLIALLQRMPQDYEVVIEGCDCYGRAAQVLVDHEWEVPCVLITRTDSRDY